MESQTPYFSREQAKSFASALYHVASIDEIHESEWTVILEFLNELGYPELAEGLAETPFSLEEAVTLFPTVHARALLVKACVQVIGADHRVTSEEREALEFMRRALMPSVSLADLLATVE